MVATRTAPTTTMTSIFSSMIAKPIACVRSSGGAPRRSGQGMSRAPAASSPKTPAEAPIAVFFPWVMSIGISAGFMPMNITM